MVDPSVGATMDGAANRVCVGDHAGGAAFWIVKRHPSENQAPTKRLGSRRQPGRGRSSNKSLQFYAFGFLCSNLGVPERLRQRSREHEMFGKFLRDESAATAIEYSLIAGFIALLIIVSVGMTGQRLVELFQSLIPALTLP
jgi:pilus assembly protein Flp/PilA